MARTSSLRSSIISINGSDDTSRYLREEGRGHLQREGAKPYPNLILDSRNWYPTRRPPVSIPELTYRMVLDLNMMIANHVQY